MDYVKLVNIKPLWCHVIIVYSVLSAFNKELVTLKFDTAAMFSFVGGKN